MLAGVPQVSPGGELAEGFQSIGKFLTARRPEFVRNRIVVEFCGEAAIEEMGPAVDECDSGAGTVPPAGVTQNILERAFIYARHQAIVR